MFGGLLLLTVPVSAARRTPRPPTTPTTPVSTLTFTKFATHPYISKTGFANGMCGCTQTFCAAGQDITDMGITDSGQLVAGYGDWSSNVDTYGVSDGGVYAVPLNLSDGTWDMAHAIRTGTEANAVVREIRGEIYMPSTDPSMKSPTGYSAPTSGFVTSEGGWRFVKDTAGLEHVFDVTSSAPNDYYEFGQSTWNMYTYGVANGYQSVDGGATWTWKVADDSAVSSAKQGWERYYWAARLNGKVYIHAAGTDPVSPGRVLDESTGAWSEFWPADGTRICSTIYANQVVVFDGYIVCPGTTMAASAQLLNLFDGTKLTQAAAPGGVSATDFYVARDGYLYALSGWGIYRTRSLHTVAWEYLGTVPIAAEGNESSLAVYDKKIYVSSGGGVIYRASLN